MLNTIIGTKKSMGQAFEGDLRMPVTHVQAGPCIITQIKKPQNDGYWSIQLGFGSKKIKDMTKPLQGHLKGALKSKKKAPRFLREIRVSDKPKLKVGDEVKVGDIFSKGDVVQVTGVSKGKGFAGVVKRWGFKGGPRTHGQSDRLRAPGSIGQGTDPGRVHKGKKMPGRMGTQKVTVKNLQVVAVDEDGGQLTLSGPIPGAYGGLLIIKKLSEGKLEDTAVKVQKVVEGEGEEGVEAEKSSGKEEDRVDTEAKTGKEQG